VCALCVTDILFAEDPVAKGFLMDFGYCIYFEMNVTDIAG